MPYGGWPCQAHEPWRSAPIPHRTDARASRSGAGILPAASWAGGTPAPRFPLVPTLPRRHVRRTANLGRSRVPLPLPTRREGPGRVAQTAIRGVFVWSPPFRGSFGRFSAPWKAQDRLKAGLQTSNPGHRGLGNTPSPFATHLPQAPACSFFSSPRLWGRHLACRILGRRDACPTRIPERGDAGASKTAHHTAERCDEKAHGIPTRERGGREKERAPPLAAANGKRAKQQMAIGVLGRERHEKRYRCSGPQGRACAGPRSAGAWER